MPTNDQPFTDDGRTQSLRLVLEGERAKLGDVLATDVTRLIDGVIRVVGRAAEQITGRQTGQVGRRGAAIEAATRFRFGEIFEGSVGVLLRAPEGSPTDQSAINLDDRRLTELAITDMLNALSGASDDAYVAESLANLADELDIGVRYTGLRLTIDTGSVSSRSELLDRSNRTRLRRVANRQPPTATTAVAGTLVEADFERHTARLRTSSNRKVTVRFDETHADDVQAALRRHAELDGVVTYDENSKQVTAVELRAVRRTHQLGLDLEDDEFWRRPTIAELAAQQGVGPVDVETMRDTTASREELDRFFEALDL